MLLLSSICALLPLQGCFVSSAFPFYNDQNVIFDSGLLGAWSVDKGSAILLFTDSPQADVYLVIYTENEIAQAYDARLFEIAKIRYLDVVPTQNSTKSREIHLKPTHSLWRISFDQDELRLTNMGSTFVKQLIDDHSTQIDGLVLNKEEILITSPTRDLQDFIRANTEKLFSPDDLSTWKRQRP
jgi:hypothetical protein